MIANKELTTLEERIRERGRQRLAEAVKAAMAPIAAIASKGECESSRFALSDVRERPSRGHAQIETSIISLLPQLQRALLRVASKAYEEDEIASFLQQVDDQ